MKLNNAQDSICVIELILLIACMCFDVIILFETESATDENNAQNFVCVIGTYIIVCLHVF